VPTRYDLAGRATVTLEGDDATVERYLEGQMDPFRPGGGGSAPEVVLAREPAALAPRWTDVQRPAGDGMVTAAGGGAFAILQDGRHCTVPDPLAEGAISFRYREGFPISRIFAPVIRAALQVAMAFEGSVALHATTVVADGGAIAVAGWSESGKTEVALALMEDGARFVSDKWTVVGRDGVVSPFPVRVGIRRWVLRYLPRLRASLPASASAQLAAAGAASALAGASARFPDGPLIGRASEVLGRAASLAGRASLTPTELRTAYGEPEDDLPLAPLRAVAVLTTVPAGQPVEAHPIDATWAAQRLSRSAAFERRRFFAVHERARFALPERRGDLVTACVERERALLEDVFSGVSIVGVRAPFPTDPRVVAAAVARCL
jgi:hypothetical protein